MKGNKKEIQTKDKSISYTHIETGSKTICFLFSGSGYNYDKPLFYYSTMVMLENKMDVVHVHYSYEGSWWDKPIEEMSTRMMEDIQPVITEVLQSNSYSEIIFLGKSLGTIPIAIHLMEKEEFVDATMILLTPLLQFDSIFDSILNSKHKGILVIGDKDPIFNSNQIEQLNNSKIEIEIIRNANHSLDIGKYETTNSIVALSTVMEKLNVAVASKTF
ncbi:alpha/beta family hydrolase [Solibacillus sp. CAU 1738]|uniref:alpha/beta family hydrolase n=1 Tax=Solibacillus sp. CAU 1738 TaxID=3140363 RepID=UPI00326009D8